MAATNRQRLNDFPQDLLLAEPGQQLMFDDRLYKRGALALHVVRRACGDDAFFDLLRSWVHEHRHGSVTIADFVDHVERHAGAAVANRLRPWLDARPLPPLSA